MEILNNFSSIYCFITFVIGAVFMLAMLSIAAMGKDYEPRNKVRFFVKKLSNATYRLYFKDKNGNNSLIAITAEFYLWGLNIDDFANMK